MPIFRKAENSATKNLSEAEKALGVDLKLNEDNDLELNNLSDLKLVSGVDNAAQAVKIKLGIEPKGLVYHPSLGTALFIGSKITNLFLVKTQILKSLTQDPRFENISVNITAENNVIFVDIRITLTNTGTEIPLQFSVLNA